jgi:hypothetical protein
MCREGHGNPPFHQFIYIDSARLRVASEAAAVDILKKQGKIKYALILLGKISYGNGSPLPQADGIFLIIHWKLGDCENRQICRCFSRLATILLLIDRPACAGFIWFPSNLLVTNKNSVTTVRGTAVA